MGFLAKIFRKNTSQPTISEVNKEKISTDDSSIYEISVTPENSKEVSEKFYQRHLQNIAGYEDISELDIIDRDLTPVEIDFLKYLNGKAPYEIAGYWTHEVNLNISAEIRIFLANNFLEFKVDPNNLTINDLKPLLKNKNLKVSGKKSELIERFNNAYSLEEVNSLELPKKLCLTDKGILITKNARETLTHDPVFEKECIELIQNNELVEAFRKICLWEAAKPAKRGLGIDWNRAAANPEIYMPTIYDDMCRYEYLPNEDDTKMLVSLRIFATFLGMNPTALSKKYISSWIPNY